MFSLKIATVFVLALVAGIIQSSSSLQLFNSFEQAFCEHGEHGKGKKTGNFADPRRCDKFITCENFKHRSRNSRATTQHCPYGLFFNSKIGVCDWPRNVDCFLYQGQTCYGGRNNAYGSVRATQTGYIRGIKLIHVNGYVNCKYYKPTYKSFWGCNTKTQSFKYLVNTWITTSRNKRGVIFPTKNTRFDRYGNYQLKRYSQRSPYIKWNADHEHPIKIKQHQELRIWYGEDLHDIHEFDNAGTHCVDVYVLFSFYRPYYYFNRD